MEKKFIICFECGVCVCFANILINRYRGTILNSIRTKKTAFVRNACVVNMCVVL
jgi:general stress protein CsbA